jgi:hypothetical protein
MEPSPSGPSGYFVRIPPRLPVYLSVGVTFLLIMHVTLQVWHYEVHLVPDLFKDLFDVNEENNFPSWYSTAMLLLTSGILFAIAGKRRREGAPDARPWFWLSVIYCFLSLDECAGLHETVNTMMDGLHGGIYFTWVLVWTPLVLVFAWIYLRFWWGLPPRVRLLVAIAGVAMVGSQLGIEEFSMGFDSEKLPYNLMTAVEEGFKMYSEALFIHALLLYIRGSDRVPATIGIET